MLEVLVKIVVKPIRVIAVLKIFVQTTEIVEVTKFAVKPVIPPLANRKRPNGQNLIPSAFYKVVAANLTPSV